MTYDETWNDSPSNRPALLTVLVGVLVVVCLAGLAFSTFALVHEREALEKAKIQREELLEQTRRDIDAETRRAIQEIRNEVADLTVMATEKVTRKTLDEDDQKRLVEEALRELDFSALGGEQRN